MIYLLLGENQFEKSERLNRLKASFDGEIDRFAGEGIEPGLLREILTGQTLFSQNRLIVISKLSESSAWQELSELPLDDVELILLEDKVDKRTKTYKWLKKEAKIEEFNLWSDWDRDKAVSWCQQRAKQAHGVDLKRELAAKLVERLGTDQMRLDGVLAQLSLAEKVDWQLVDELVPLAKTESVFGLFEAALDGRLDEIKRIVAFLEAESGDDGAYMTLGLLASQLLQLNGLVLSGGDVSRVASDFGANPRMVRRLEPYAKQIDRARLRKINQSLSQADLSMKTAYVSPWLIIETALVEISNK